MSLIDFKSRFEQGIHGLLWRQWSQLGVAGAVTTEGRWLLDPEALLLMTLEAARTDPRLFDEVLDWLLTNGNLIDVQRLRNLLAEDKEYPKALLLGVASLLAEHETSAKWSRLSTPLDQVQSQGEPLFLLSPDRALPDLQHVDPYFRKAGYLRSPVEPRGLSRPVPMQAGPCLRLRLRSFLGIGIRVEAILFLLTHPESNADEVARAIGYSFPGVQQVLREMADSALIHVRRTGREKRYWLEKERWGDFLDVQFFDSRDLAARSEAARRLAAASPQDIHARRKALEELLSRESEPEKLSAMEHEGRRRAAVRLLRTEVVWVNWSRLFHGLARILRFLRQPGWLNMSDYIRASEFARVVSAASGDLEAAELGFHVPRQQGNPLDDFVLAAESALQLLLESGQQQVG